MTQHNVGALVVVKPGEQNAIAGIITERGTQYGIWFGYLALIIWVHF